MCRDFPGAEHLAQKALDLLGDDGGARNMAHATRPLRGQREGMGTPAMLPEDEAELEQLLDGAPEGWDSARAEAVRVIETAVGAGLYPPPAAWPQVLTLFWLCPHNGRVRADFIDHPGESPFN